MRSFGAQPPEVVALLPAKRFDTAKSRLSERLSPAHRQRLAQQFFDHVLGVLSNCPGIASTTVLTDGSDVADRAAARRANVLMDGAEPGLGRRVDHALDRLGTRGVTRVLVLMGDLPHLSVADVESVLAAGRDHDFVLAPDGKDQGTNALLLSLPRRGPTHFGTIDSFPRHRADATHLGASLAVVERPGLSFDVDGVDDLARFLATPDRG